MKEDMRYFDYDGLLTYINHLFEITKNTDSIQPADQAALKKILEAIRHFLLSAKTGSSDTSAFMHELMQIDIKSKENLISQKKKQMIFNSSGEKIILGKCIGEGGEGTVYKIPSLPGKVAKLFRDNIDVLHKKTRIEALMKYRTANKINNILVAAFPEDLLFKEDHSFAGYIMPQVSSTLKLYHVLRDSERKTYFPELNYKGMIIIAYNLAELIHHLHTNGIVMGDMNQNNISLYPDGTICLIDCDSFDITDPQTGEHFPCTVGLPELLAPELQSVGSLTKGRFTKESDNFSLAIHIFRLLMNNADPFGAKVVGIQIHSQTAFDVNRSVINGECVYVRDIPGKMIPKWSPTMDILPDDIQKLFKRSFFYTSSTIEDNIKNRPTAKEWMNALLRFYQMPLKQCASHPFHWYLPKFSECPFCHLEPI